MTWICIFSLSCHYITESRISYQKSLRDSDEYAWAYDYDNVTTTFPNDEVGRRLNSISKMIGSRECRGSDRDLFYLEHRGYDHHFNLVTNLASHFNTLNEALRSFVDEMKSKDIWDQVAIVVSSDFGR